MAKQLDNKPIHKLLTRLGYKWIETCGGAREAEFRWKTPQGAVHLMKYQRLTGECGAGGRYLVGIAYGRFNDVHDFVFWAEGEPFFLIVPSQWLKETFEVYQYDRKRVGKQWHVNIIFDEGGRQKLHPVFCESLDVSAFAHKV